MKRIFIDARSIYKDMDGLGMYSLYFIRRLLHKLNNMSRFYICLPPSARNSSVSHEPMFSNCELIFTERERFGNYAYDFADFEKIVSGVSPDVFISTAFFSTTYLCIKIVVIHDLIPLVSSKLREEKIQFYSNVINMAVSTSDLVVVPSYFTRREIQRHYSPRKRKIQVLYPDVEKCIKRFKEAESRDGHGRFLMVGIKCPRKNADLVVSSLKLMKTKGCESCKVFFIGKEREVEVGLRRMLKSELVEDLGSVLGYITENELRQLVAGSRGLLYPSLYEGFGIPVVEFLGCYKPVICIKNTSIIESAGGVGYYIKNEPESLAQAMYDVKTKLNNGHWRTLVDSHLKKLSVVNQEQYDKFFSWIGYYL